MCTTDSNLALQRSVTTRSQFICKLHLNPRLTPQSLSCAEEKRLHNFWLHVAFPLSHKYVTLNDLEWLFYFAPMSVALKHGFRGMAISQTCSECRARRTVNRNEQLLHRAVCLR